MEKRTLHQRRTPRNEYTGREEEGSMTSYAEWLRWQKEVIKWEHQQDMAEREKEHQFRRGSVASGYSLSQRG